MVTMRRLSVKGIIQASEKTHTNQSDGFAEIVDSADSLRGDSPPPPSAFFFVYLFFFYQPEPVKRSGFDMLSLNYPPHSDDGHVHELPRS